MSDEKPFSPKSARLAVEELFMAIPKSRRLDHIGAYNEALVVLGSLAKGLDENEEVA